MRRRNWDIVCSQPRTEGRLQYQNKNVITLILNLSKFNKSIIRHHQSIVSKIITGFDIEKQRGDR